MITPLLAVALFCAPATASADAPADARCLRASRVAEPIRLDGRLDDAAWASADPGEGFRQREPAEGQPATEATEVRVLFDDRALYVGVLARDDEPEKLLARILQRDRVMEEKDGRHVGAGDDMVAILLDPFGDRRSGVVLATNPNGAEFDALVTDEAASFNADWRGLWSVAALRVPEGWSAEFAIPFRSLRHPDAKEHAWGLNVLRVVRRKNEETLWSGWQREGGGLNRVSRAGRLVGLECLPRSGKSLDIKPFLATGLAREQDVTATNGQLSAGFDAKYEVHPGLVLDAALKPDFAQVEADDQQVNLTRFGLFFPEKREFFLENAGMFDFGAKSQGGPPPFLLFFSRSIGFSEDGEVPVNGGVRLTGRAGAQTVGFLGARTGAAFGRAPTSYGVGRVKRDVGSSGYVGAMLTDLRLEGYSNTAAGVDASLWPTKALNVQAFVAHTQTSGEGGDGSAYRLRVDYQKDRVGLTASHTTVDPEVNAEMGFVQRKDLRRTGAVARYTLRPSLLGIRKAELFPFAESLTRVNGEPQDWWGGSSFQIEWNSGETLGGFYERDFTRLDESFDVADRLAVIPGDYRFGVGGIFGGTSPNRPVSASGFAFRQGFYDGDLSGFGVEATLRAGAHLSSTLGYRHNAVRLTRGALDADLATLRAGYAFSRHLTTSALVQWNRAERTLDTNIRMAWNYRPGSDVFVAWSEGRGTDTGLTSARARRLIVKMTWLVQL